MARLKAIFCSRGTLALLVGVLLALAFPKVHLAVLAWIAPALALLVASGAETGKRRFLYGWLFGLGFNLTSLYWLWFIPVTFFPILGWLALSAWQALYYAIWVWLCLRIAPVDVFKPVEQGKALASGWFQRVFWALLCAAIWVALEMIMARLLTGFPWLTLGVSQYRMTALIQVASLTGVYGVSFLVIWFSVSLLNALVIIRQRQMRLWAWLAEMILPLGAVLIVCAMGIISMSTKPPGEKLIKFALIQPSIPQTVKWDAAKNKVAFEKVLHLSRLALETKPDVLVWPEAATPGLLRYNEELLRTVTRMASEGKVWLILGADDGEANQATPDPDDGLYYNSSFLVSPTGELLAKHDKQKLVVFGEYVPFADVLPFLKWFTPIEGGFTPGKDQTPFELKELGIRSGILICFEDIFPHFVRLGVKEDVNLLINLTNNGWFGESAAQWQHAANAAFRAVENRRTLVRCSNNGLTCWVDPWGRMTVSSFGEGDVYREGFDIATVPVQELPTTFYTRHGDVFGWACVSALLALVMALWRGRNKS
ncbi:MAG: lnt-1 [Verrucomicrobia bacterium]|jgi:apolipoprotein N-acyltransferase|nr:lnt-1 [Verrucomicrobiota bacterium]